MENLLVANSSSADTTGKSIILFNIMSGMCSKNCPNCYDSKVKKENMEPRTYNKFFSLIDKATQIPNSKISRNLSTIASRMIEYPYLIDYLNAMHKYGFTTSVYASNLGKRELNHPAITSIIFHLTKEFEKEIETAKELEASGIRIDIRYNFIKDIWTSHLETALTY